MIKLFIPIPVTEDENFIKWKIKKLLPIHDISISEWMICFYESDFYNSNIIKVKIEGLLFCINEKDLFHFILYSDIRKWLKLSGWVLK